MHRRSRLHLFRAFAKCVQLLYLCGIDLKVRCAEQMFLPHDEEQDGSFETQRFIEFKLGNGDLARVPDRRETGIWPYFLPMRQTYADASRTICREESMTSASALAESFSIATSVSP